MHVGAAALPEDGVAVPAALARREMQRLVHVAEEVDQEAKRDPAAGLSRTRGWISHYGVYSQSQKEKSGERESRQAHSVGSVSRREV